ncbi:uncharacterized protein LOC127043580 [Gopherus flavomarginatus]|uniref:uncharacterized protein LOC127043580 n=1 Tax=Gopherus flavomarginatus TaxID=286002 RepID=UPI0021CBDE5F|nr:uncharacterized protein LOC127043580 [Gopherus flavomarginatus]XP_050793499.1 uncharacterized protein LOC127043580 [Gopherus flavomarginatus]XP_050793500.1 uncharacterized protein LOC127043580 [Gopherus flavomarginatus]
MATLESCSAGDGVTALQLTLCPHLQSTASAATPWLQCWLYTWSAWGVAIPVLVMQRCSSSVASKSAFIGLQGIRRYPSIPFQPLCSSFHTPLPWAQVTRPLNAPGILKIPFLFAQPGVECNQSLTMPPRPKRAPAWNTSELQDLISVWGEEAVQSQLRSSRRNYDTYGQISKSLLLRGHEWDALQCRVKVKELRSAYCKAREGNRRSGAAPTTCRFYKELDAILGCDPTANPRSTMESSEQGEVGEGVEEAESEATGVEGDTPESQEACNQELFSSQKEASQLQQLELVGEEEAEERVPGKQILFLGWKCFVRGGWGLWLPACMPKCGIAH